MVTLIMYLEIEENEANTRNADGKFGTCTHSVGTDSQIKVLLARYNQIWKESWFIKL